MTPSVTVYGGRTVAVDDSSGDIYVAIWNSEVGTIWVFTSSGAGTNRHTFYTQRREQCLGVKGSRSI